MKDNGFRICRIILLVLLLVPSNKLMAQVYNDDDVFGLFAERKVFYPDFNFATNSSVGFETVIDKEGQRLIAIIIDGKIAPLYLEKREIQGNNIVFLVRDRNGFGCQMVVTLLSSGKMQMYFIPVKTETNDIFVYGFGQQKTYAYSWYEPSMSGLVSHPECESRAEATKKYYTSTFDESFSSIINDGRTIISRKVYRIYEEKRKKEEELKRQRLEEERRRREEAERIRRENTKWVTVIAPEIGRDITIELNDKSAKNKWTDSLYVGSYTVRCTSKSYNTLTQTINVTKEDTVFVLDRMTPQTINYTFVSPEKQKGASVYINDRFVGKTPITASINLVEPNKIEYKSIGYTTRRFFLTYENNASISTTPNTNSTKVSGVSDFSNSSLTAKMKKNRSGGIDKDGNVYYYLGGGLTSYPSINMGISTDVTAKHFNFVLSLNLNARDSNLFLQTGMKFGWGFSGNYYRITPQIGMDIDWGTKEKIQYNDQNEAYLANVPYAAVFYFPIGVKFEYALWRWFVIAVTPEMSWCGKKEGIIWGLRFNMSLINHPEHSLKKL